MIADGVASSEAEGHKRLACAFLRNASQLESSVQRWLRDDDKVHSISLTLHSPAVVYQTLVDLTETLNRVIYP